MNIGLSKIKKPLLVGSLGSLSGAGIGYATIPNSQSDSVLTDIGELKEITNPKDPIKEKREATIALIKTKISVEKLRSTATQDHVVNEGQFVIPELEDTAKGSHIQSSLNKHKSKIGNKIFNSTEDAQKYCLEDIDGTNKEITLRNLTHEDISESFCIGDSRKDTSRSQSD